MKKILKKHPLARSGIFGGLPVMMTVLTVWSQTAPVLTIKPSGTSQYSVTITNSIGSLDYDLEWTPVLGNGNFLWTFAAIGVPGGTNFLLDADAYPATFFRAVLDTNTPPLWQSSNPNVPGSPILTVIIASPANGANLSQ